MRFGWTIDAPHPCAPEKRFGVFTLADKGLRVGVIGVGAIGRTHIVRINGKLRGATVTACADPAAEFGKTVAQELGLIHFQTGEDLIRAPDIDAIVIAANDEHHEHFVLTAVAAGKPVFCEKPLSPDKAGCRRIVDAEMAGGRKLVRVGFMRRYDPGYRQLKRHLQERTFGEVLMAHCAHRNHSIGGRFTTPMSVENAMIHEIDVMRWLLGEDYDTVEVALPKKTRNSHENLWDPQVMVLTTKSGVRIDVEAFLNCHYGYDIKCEICCEEGCINLPEPANAMIRTEASRIYPIAEHWSERFEDAYNIEFQDWIDDTQAGRMSGPSAWDGYIAAATAAAASRARETRALVNIDPEPCPAFYLI